MSLSVYLTGPVETAGCRCCDCGHEHTRAKQPELYWANVTHNLNTMAYEAGIYRHLWRPEEVGVTKAAQLIEPLEAGLALLKSDPDRFIKFNPPNGWGDYGGFVRWVGDYLAACKEHPEAEVSVSR